MCVVCCIDIDIDIDVYTEKRIPYKVVKVAMRCYGDKPRSFMQMNPSGGIPVAIIKVGRWVGRWVDGRMGKHISTLFVAAFILSSNLPLDSFYFSF